MSQAKKTVLIAGASGIIGNAAVHEFLKHPDWDVVALSRREPEIASKKPYQFLSLDLRNKHECEKALKNLPQVTHIIFAALFEKPGLIAGWGSPDQMQINLDMLQNIVEPLTNASGHLKHISLLQGTKAYGVHLHPISIPAREEEPRDPHDNFYWLQEDYIREKATKHGFHFTILRPQLVVGGCYGVNMNLIPVIGVYAAICREEGMPFSFPGGSSLLFELVDTRLIARLFIWAATAENAKNETFNVTNGEVSEWRNLWPFIAKMLDMRMGPDTEIELKTFLPKKSHVWDKIVSKYNLRKIKMDDLLGESHHYADILFAYGVKEVLPPIIVSTIKLRQAGFNDCIDSRDTLKYWLNNFVERKILPPTHGVE
jgi:nucleoside-diphosphate-sugar epimerase